MLFGGTEGWKVRGSKAGLSVIEVRADSLRAGFPAERTVRWPSVLPHVADVAANYTSGKDSQNAAECLSGLLGLFQPVNSRNLAQGTLRAHASF